jgi:L-2-hydroxyglutarate oxidase
VLEVVANPAIVHHREGYRPRNFDLDDTLLMWRSRGFWRMVFRHGPRSIRDSRQFNSARKLKKAVERLLPHAGVQSVTWRRAGVHAQAVTTEGSPLHDLVVREAPRMIHVLNAPSPAATACLSIGRSLAALAARVVEPSRTLVAARPA